MPAPDISILVVSWNTLALTTGDGRSLSLGIAWHRLSSPDARSARSLSSRPLTVSAAGSASAWCSRERFMMRRPQ